MQNITHRLFAGIFAASLFFVPAFAEDLRQFVTDGCTGWFDGTRKAPTLWRHCCVRHDLAFWAGAAGQRDQADLDLRDCIAATGAVKQAKLMYFGVRIGSKSPKKFAGMQWGNAWSPTVSRKTPLSREEIDVLEHELFDARYDTILEAEYRRVFIDALRSN